MQFVMQRPPTDDRARPALSSSVASLRTLIPVAPHEAADAAVWRAGVGAYFDLASRSSDPIRIARGGGAIFIYGGGGAAIPKPAIEGDVHFFARPVEAAPP